jgi:hypothetical protein
MAANGNDDLATQCGADKACHNAREAYDMQHGSAKHVPDDSARDVSGSPGASTKKTVWKAGYAGR